MEKHTPQINRFRSTGLSPAIMLYGHPVQDAVPCHKSALTREWHDEKLKVDREAAARKQKLQKYHNRSTRSLRILNVGDHVCLQNAVTKRWEKCGTILEHYENARRYLIKLEFGMIICRNRFHLRKRFVDCDFTSYFAPDPSVTDFNAATNSATVTSNVQQNVALSRRSTGERRPPRRFNEYVMN